MGRVVAIASQKGGVGKTTTSINLGACLAEQGKSVLLVDMDSQGSAGSGLGVSVIESQTTIYEALIGSRPLADAVLADIYPGLDVVPSGTRLSGAEVELVGVIAREMKLRQALAPIRESYDFILIDCPPSLGILTVNTLTAADSVLIPLQCEYYALEGLTALLTTIQLVQENLNPDLAIEGILLTMYDTRLNLSAQVAEEARRYFAGHVYDTVIPRNVRLGEAPSFGKPIVVYDPTSSGSESYRDLARELTEPAPVPAASEGSSPAAEREGASPAAASEVEIPAEAAREEEKPGGVPSLQRTAAAPTGSDGHETDGRHGEEAAAPAYEKQEVTAHE